MTDTSRDLTRTTIAVLFIAGLAGTSIWIMAPFLPAVVWAATLVTATWPVMRWAQSHLWGKRSLAVAAMTAALLIVFVLPFWFAVSTIVENSERIAGWAGSLAAFTMPPPPDWLRNLPIGGDEAVQAWEKLAALNVSEVAPHAAPYAGRVTRWFVSAVGGLGLLFVEFLLTTALAAVMYASGERAAAQLQRFGFRLAGERGEQSVVLVGQAIRGVALGVVLTALVQSAIGGAALAMAAVPLASILTAAMFMMCVAQLGPGLILFPAVAWMYWSGDAGWGTFLLVASVLVVTLDNFLRPLLIRRDVDLPLLLILLGVIGGLIAFGLIGIFLGPAVLAVTYTLLQAWMAEDGGAVITPGR